MLLWTLKFMHVSFGINVFIFFWYIPRSGITESYDGFIFSFLKDLHYIFHSGCTILHTHQQCTLPFLHTLVNNCYSWSFLILVILRVMKWYFLLMILILISMMMKNGEHHFMYTLVICICSLVKDLFRSIAHFLIGLFVFWYWVVCAAFISLTLTPST